MFAISKQTIDMPGPYEWDFVDRLDTKGGNVVAVKGDKLLQTRPGGTRTYDVQPNPGEYELAKKDGGTLTYWPDHGAKPYVYLLKELP